MKRTNCLICSGKLEQYKVRGLVQCAECGFVTTDMDISAGELKKLYGEGYFKGEEYADYVFDREMTQKNFEKRLKEVLRRVDSPNEKRLFEIGCAYGFFLDVARKYFKDVKGIDISEAAVSYAREELGLQAMAGDYMDYDIQEKVDVICMWDTIEHLSRPDKYIEHAYEHLNRNGLICITTGDIGSLNARVRGAKWRQIHPPTHLHYFSTVTLQKLLEAKGFRVKYISHPSNRISLNTVLYTILVLKKNKKRLYDFFNFLRITRIKLFVNMFDFMYVLAEKG